MKRLPRLVVPLATLLASLTFFQCDSEILTDIRQVVYTLTVTAPNGGEVVVPEIPVEITWTASHSDNVQIDLLQSGTLHSTIVAGTPNTGMFSWTAPADHDQGDDFQIRIRSEGDETFGDTSDSEFTIRKLAVTSPASGQIVGDGGELSVTWETTLDNEPTIDLRLYKNGVHVDDIASGESNDGIYLWTLPGTLVNGDDYTLKVENTGTTDSNESAEFIVIHDLNVVSPNGLEVVASGTDLNIEWSPTYAGEVSLELLDAGTPATTMTTAAAGGAHTWSVPLYTYGSDQLTVEAILGALTSITDTSDAEFTILNPPTGVSATDSTSITSIDVTWNPVPGAVNYQVYRSDGGAYSQVHSTSGTSFSDTVGSTDPLPQTYTYYVRAWASSPSGGVSSQNSFTNQGSRNRNFTYQWEVGSTGSGDDQFDAPYDVAVAYNPLSPFSSDVYIADQGNDRVKRTNFGGVYVSSWGSSGTGDSQFGTIYGIAADYWGDRVYVAGDHRIQVFQLDGTFVEWWGKDSVQGAGPHAPGTASNPTSGSGDGQFNFPVDVDFDDNYVYVVEYVNNRVQRFAKDGTFEGWWGRDSVQGTGWHAPGTASSPVSGTADGALSGPWSIVAIGSNEVIVSDFLNGRLQKFTDSGVFVESFPFQVYGFMDYDGEGHIYTADGSQFRMYGVDGSLYGTFGTGGSGAGQFGGAMGIAVIPNLTPALANVNIADTGNDRMPVIWRNE